MSREPASSLFWPSWPFFVPTATASESAGRRDGRRDVPLSHRLGVRDPFDSRSAAAASPAATRHGALASAAPGRDQLAETGGTPVELPPSRKFPRSRQFALGAAHVCLDARALSPASQFLAPVNSSLGRCWASAIAKQPALFSAWLLSPLARVARPLSIASPVTKAHPAQSSCCQVPARASAALRRPVEDLDRSCAIATSCAPGSGLSVNPRGV